MVFIHYGSSFFNPSLFKKIANDETNKPLGGLWCCPVDSEYSWYDFVNDDNHYLCDISKHFNISLNDESRMLKIENYYSISTLPKTSNHTIDFEKLSLLYDAIWFSEKCVTEGRFSLELIGYDCESVIILNAQPHSVL